MREIEKERVEILAALLQLAIRALWCIRTNSPNTLPRPYTDDELARIREIAERADLAASVLRGDNPKGVT